MTADIHDIHRAAAAAELPYCPECGGNGKVYAPQRKCPCCSGTGRDGGPRAVAALAGLKAELEIAMQDWSFWKVSTKIPREVADTLMEKAGITHRRIAGHIHAATGDAELARMLGVE